MKNAGLFGKIRWDRWVARIPGEYRLPLVVAILLHVILIACLFVHMSTPSYRLPGPVSQKKIVHAVAVNAQQVNAAIKKIKTEEVRKKAAEKARLRRLARKFSAARAARLREERRLRQLKAHRLALKKAMKAKKEKQLKQAKQEKLRKALQLKQKALQERLIKQQLAAEQKNLKATQTAHWHGVVNRYKALILHQIGQYWIVPTGADRTLSCVYSVKLAVGGAVEQVTLLRSSGNPALDRSARVAIYKASPLPVPKDQALFDSFRELRLTVSPKQVITQ